MRHRRYSPLKRLRGTTLVEVLIVVVLLGILGAWGSTIFSSNFTTARMVDSGKTNADQVRYAVERLSREIREVKYTSLAAGYAITSTLSPGATTLTFTRTINGTDTTVTISQSGSTVTLGYSGGTTSTLAKQVTSFSMNFYTVVSDTGSVQATTLVTDVRYVVLSLSSTDSLSGETTTERTTITLRNS
jgi:prepilin-type N-terminal cleavage/methylation domain-containing protein